MTSINENLINKLKLRLNRGNELLMDNQKLLNNRTISDFNNSLKISQDTFEKNIQRDSLNKAK